VVIKHGFLIISLILLGLALLAAIILVFVNMKKRKTGEVKEINYKAFFAMGISFVGTGTALTAAINPGFLGITALGIIYMLIGLKNRDKWTNPEKET
jgi:O-antigen ligase